MEHRKVLIYFLSIGYFFINIKDKEKMSWERAQLHDNEETCFPFDVKSCFKPQCCTVHDCLKWNLAIHHVKVILKKLTQLCWRVNSLKSSSFIILELMTTCVDKGLHPTSPPSQEIKIKYPTKLKKKKWHRQLTLCVLRSFPKNTVST